jgi:ribokinase
VNEVAVLGSANVDMVVEVPRRPLAGETLLGSDVHVYSGGKGANQAAAAARSGATTRFIACVGRDSHGEFVREQLAHAGVDVGGVQSVDRPTGTALILLTPDGENSIVVSPGANHAMDAATADATASIWSSADVLVLNLESPLPTVEHAAVSAAARGVRVLLNAAPAQPLAARVLAVCDPLVVNEHEARLLLEDDGARSFAELAEAFLAGGVRSVVITLGAGGCIVADSDDVEQVAAYDVQAVDTTGAGDAFVGATACELARGSSLIAAVRFATAMAAISVQGMGAQSSFPERSTVEALLRGRPM